MVVDFEIGKASGFRAATVAWKAPWNEKRIRKEFDAIDRWLKSRKAKTGRWYFIEKGSDRFRVAIEVRSKVDGTARIRIRKFAPTAVVRVAFDPDELSPRIVYHGLNDFLRWRRKDKTIRSVGDYREVYDGNPWTDPKVWAGMRVEALVRK
jgi:hypothetical protein